MTTNTAKDTRCHSCQVEADVLAGTASQADRNHWSMWGCTCTRESAANAIEFINKISR